MPDLDEKFHELTIEAFHDGLLNGTMTAAELVDWYLARIGAHNHSGVELQAVVTVNPRAREEAAARDEFFATYGQLAGPLHGVPFLVKDQIETAGLRTTFGSILFEDYVPQSDATVITQLKEAGAIVLAKTALTDFAAGWFSSSSMSGHTKNPYCLSRDSGGSSAGTAAGVAANFGLVGIGGDTGGSIRVPASFNNLYGLRVTTGLISRTGCSPLVHFQDTPGPMARTVSDLAKTLDSIVGYDRSDPFTVTALSAPDAGGYARAVDVDISLARWRIGVLETGFGSDEDPDAAAVNSVVRSAVARLEQLGVSAIPDIEIADLSGWISDTSVYVRQSKSDISDFLASRPDAPVSSFRQLHEHSKAHAQNDLFDAMAEGPDTSEGDVEGMWLRLNQEHFRRIVLNMFADRGLDFLVYPTVQVLPPRRQDLSAERYRTLNFSTNTVIGSQAGLPALTMPVGFAGSGLPIGLELLGTPLAETKMLQFARAWEKSERTRAAPCL
jgi:amidase